MSTTTADETGARDYQILGVVSLGHFMSHFYYMALPPLFIELREAYGVSYAQLGLVLAVMYTASAIVQVPIGFLVDRIGARGVLVAGLVATSVTVGAIGLAPSFWIVVALAVLSGISNAVFHPTDYAILNSSISSQRMGRAFSIHTFAGQLGTAAAPMIMIALTAALGWRMGLVASGIIGLVATLLLLAQWGQMREDVGEAQPATPPKAGAKLVPADAGAGLKLLLSWQMMTFFMFFAMLAMMQGGLQSFAVTALVTLNGTPLATATTALSVYLFASAAGTLIGGEITDRIERHDLLAAGTFVLGAAICVVLALVKLPAAALFLAMAVMGVTQGITRPARDLMLRAVTPKGSSGKVFGFVTSGIALGAGLAPVPFGWLLDIGRPAWVFYLLAIFMMVSLVTVMVPKQPAVEATDR